MTGFEPQVSGVGSDRSANCATTTAHVSVVVVPSLVLPVAALKRRTKGERGREREREREMMIRLTNQNDEAFSDIIF